MDRAQVTSGSKPSFIRFLLVNGILLFGVPVAVVIALVRAFTAAVPWHEYLFTTPVMISLLAQAVVSGLAFGAVVWFLRRRTIQADRD